MQREPNTSLSFNHGTRKASAQVHSISTHCANHDVSISLTTRRVLPGHL